MPFPALIPIFFFSSWLTMIFWGIIAPDLGIVTIGYPKAMLVTIALWLVVGPMARPGGGKKKSESKFNFIGSIGKSAVKGKKRGWSGNSQSVDGDTIKIESSFSGISRRATSQNFKGGEVTTSFGGVQLDLRGAKLAPEGATLNIKAFVGGVEALVPEGWDIEMDVSGTIAGTSDERSHPGGQGAPKLVITGSATLGGITLKDG
jgi:predicted membrane protein